MYVDNIQNSLFQPDFPLAGIELPLDVLKGLQSLTQPTLVAPSFPDAPSISSLTADTAKPFTMAGRMAVGVDAIFPEPAIFLSQPVHKQSQQNDTPSIEISPQPSERQTVVQQLQTQLIKDEALSVHEGLNSAIQTRLLAGNVSTQELQTFKSIIMGIDGVGAVDVGPVPLARNIAAPAVQGDIAQAAYNRVQLNKAESPELPAFT